MPKYTTLRGARWWQQSVPYRCITATELTFWAEGVILFSFMVRARWQSTHGLSIAFRTPPFSQHWGVTGISMLKAGRASFRKMCKFSMGHFWYWTFIQVFQALSIRFDDRLFSWSIATVMNVTVKSSSTNTKFLFIRKWCSNSNCFYMGPHDQMTDSHCHNQRPIESSLYVRNGDS